MDSHAQSWPPLALCRKKTISTVTREWLGGKMVTELALRSA